MEKQNLPSEKKGLFDGIKGFINKILGGTTHAKTQHPFPELIPFEKAFDKAIRSKTNANATIPIKMISEDSWAYLKKKYPQLELPYNHPLHYGYKRNKAKIEKGMRHIEAGERICLDEYEEKIFKSFVTMTGNEASQIIRPKIIKTSIAGFKYHDFKKKEVKEMLEMDPNQRLELEREPENKYDSDAVRIIWDSYFLGYVPREYSTEVSDAILENKDISCFLEDYSKTGRIEERTQIEIRINDGFTI